MLVGRRGLSPVLIGRAEALARLRGLVAGGGRDRRDTDLPAVALVAGEAGVGKTRLLQELVDTVPTMVLAGHAEPGSLGRPLDLVRSMVGQLPGDTGELRTRAVDALLARIGEEPAVAIFEDLHWADSDSVAVFESLAAASLPRLTLVASYRRDELTSRLPGGEMLVRLERRRHVHQVDLERLDRHEIGAFLAAVYDRYVGTAVVDALRSRTGGNAFFLEEILTAAGDIEPERLADQPLPWSLTELVSHQLDGLSGEERRVVEAAAVLGARAPFDVLAALSQHSEELLIPRLRTLVERGLLVEERDDEFSFRHELVRDAVEGQLLGRERRRLHEQALTLLRDAMATDAMSGDLADLARHAAGAGRYDEMVALARDGVAHYLGVGSTHQALRLAVDALAESPEDVDLLAGAARAAWLIGAHDEAWGHAERLLATAHEPPERRAAALRLAARIAHERRDNERMWELVAELEHAVAELPPGEERAAAMAAIAQIDMLHDRPADAVDWAERAALEADTVGAKAVHAQAVVERASALADLPARRAEGIPALRAAVEEAEHVGDWVLVARALHNLCNIAPAADRRGYLEQMRDAGRRAGFDHMVTANYFVRVAGMEAADGDAEAAMRDATRAIDTGPGKTRSWATSIRAWLLLEAGRTDEAVALGAPWDGQSSSEGEQCSVHYLVQLAARRGDRDAATVALGRLTTDKVGRRDSAEVLLAVEAALAAGVAEADVVAVLDVPGADPLDELERIAVDALVAGARADHDAVLGLLANRIDDVAAGLPATLQTSLRLHLARALAAHSRLGEARDQATAARAALERWPGWRRDEVDALLRRLDSAGTTEGELTRREREVAALLAEGLSNSELARRLYISPKTAAVHVSNILTKLGLSNRAEIAAWAVRNGVTAA